jgi:hypothetical protein
MDNIMRNTYPDMRFLIPAALSAALLLSAEARAGWDFITLQEWVVEVDKTVMDEMTAMLCFTGKQGGRLDVLRRAQVAGAGEGELRALAARYDQTTAERRHEFFSVYRTEKASGLGGAGFVPDIYCGQFTPGAKKPAN